MFIKRLSMRIFLLLCFAFIVSVSEAQTKPNELKFPVDSGYLTYFDGSKIYYEVRGKGKPVVLVHDFIVNNMRGNGKSGKPHDTARFGNQRR